MLTSLLTQTPFFICLFWFLFFITQRNNPNQKSRDMLALFMFIGLTLHISHIAYFNGRMDVYLYFDWLFMFTSLAIAPSYYLYVKTIAIGPLTKKDFLQFSPAILMTAIYLIQLYLMTDADKSVYLYEIISAEKRPKMDIHNPAHRIAVLFIINRIIFAAQTIYYIIITAKNLKDFTKKVRDYYSDSEGKELQWVLKVIIMISVISVFSTIFNIWGRPVFKNNDLMLSLPSILFSGILFMIGLFANAQKFTINDLKKEQEGNNHTDHFEENHPSQIRKKLEDLIHEGKIFLTKDLRITDLCKELNTNRTYLSQVFNDELKVNFNTYINKHRVEYAISLLEKKEWKHYSLEKFSELSGFGSTTSMIRSFKHFTGKTPSEYRL